MADNTKIEWTDSTWNIITGCSVVSAGCKHCYAMKLAGTRLQHHPSREGLTIDTAAGPVWNGQVRFNEQWLDQPLRWRRPRRIFVCAHGDLFHESVPDEWIDKVFAVMALAPQHTFQVLTKRADRMRDYMTKWPDGAGRVHHVRSALHKILLNGRKNWSAQDPEWHRAMAALPLEPTATSTRWPLPNVWLGVSAENQDAFDKRYPLLVQTPAAVRWISAEPLLGPISFDAWPLFGPDRERLLHWVVAGGESGTGARPMHPDWARSLRDQCAAAGVAFMIKQWGEWHTAAYHASTGLPVFRQFDCYQSWVNKASTWVQGGICLDRHGTQMRNGGDMARARDANNFPVTIMHKVGKKAAGRLLDGVLHDAYPEVRRG